MTGDTPHPDQAWLDQVITDLTAWCDMPPVDDPTSQVTGQGAIAAVETLASRLHDNRRALLTPSATYGLWAALTAAGARPGTTVIVPTGHWPAAAAAARTCGATITTITRQDPDSITAALTDHTVAAVTVHGTEDDVDVPAIADRLPPGVTLIEDAAAAYGITLHAPIGVFSFGPGKTIDVGEAGLVLTRPRALHDAVIAAATHPARQVLTGIHPTRADRFSIRPHPLAAILLYQRLTAWACAHPPAAS